MADINISDAELGSFYDDLKTGLSPEQVKLLDVILTIAWQVTANEESLKHEFAGSFTPDEATLLLDYSQLGGANAPGGHVLFPRMIKAGLIR